VTWPRHLLARAARMPLADLAAVAATIGTVGLWAVALHLLGG
jgi:hypothetical protein